jgi:hypothetical protein
MSLEGRNVDPVLRYFANVSAGFSDKGFCLRSYVSKKKKKKKKNKLMYHLGIELTWRNRAPKSSGLMKKEHYFPHTLKSRLNCLDCGI